ncbi:protein of unknown function (plasmid) [Cupriavidus taiwanensis]|uniref:Uncharacterized protein n=1 Tax=Cupriavidus taiwanensis TaxID=164546 RepID=A0A375EDL8_9BURK|nr:protein of unknown function [Cupriavidus taiwanensis]SOZ72222.1 protein of unknown function [Cupriavidus taiwanensis]SOZ74527.1 protein of unknown function [Cupriavidus taiwanensis]SPA03450.1 protein of unknown function [Cupriavidus taiwanensis]SPA11320.1 protein of unknown function [Cupriavidus taiwanensis]
MPWKEVSLMDQLRELMIRASQPGANRREWPGDGASLRRRCTSGCRPTPSRAKVRCDQRAETVQSKLIATFRRYGLPQRMTMDNGPP